MLPLVLAAVIAFLASAVTSHVLTAAVFDSTEPGPSVSPTGPPVATGDQPLIAGEPGTAVAVDPVLCPDACFDQVSILALTMDEWDFERLGLPEPDLSDEERLPVAMSELVDGPTDGLPKKCSFASNAAPGAVLAADVSSTDPVFRTGAFEDLDGIDRGEQWARLFPNSAAASSHLAALESSIRSCGLVTTDSSSTGARVITAAPALDLPDGVAVVGWVSTSSQGPGWREYVFDIQSSNAVIRVRFITDGSVTEKRVRSSVEAYTRQVGFNAPRPGEGSAG